MTVCVWLLLALFAVTGPAIATELRVWTEGDREPFVLDSLARDRISLAAQRDRVVLVHFFATWCEPCRAEMAALQRLAERSEHGRLAILAVNVGEPDTRVRRFFDTLPVVFPILLDRDQAITKAWQVTTLPTTFVLDRTLAPRLVVEGDLDWDAPDANHALAQLANDSPRDGK